MPPALLAPLATAAHHAITPPQAEDCRALLDELLPAAAWAHLAPLEQQHVAFFLRQKGVRSSATRRVYAAHLARFLVWLRLSGAERLDEWVVMNYQQALLNPTPAMRAHPDVVFNAVSEETADQYLAPVRSFLAHLATKGLLQYNPGAFVPALGVRNREAVAESRHFVGRHWAALLDTLEALPIRTPGERNRRARFRFVIRFAYAMALRINELATHSHQHVRRTENDHWVLSIVGKGRRARRLPLVIDDVDALAWEALTEYRSFLGLAPEPAGEPLPLLPRVKPVTIKRRGPNPGVTIQSKALAPSVWQVQFGEFLRNEVMRHLYETPERRADAYESWAHYTPHSLRHTRITHLVNTGKSLLWVQKFAGHESLDTTSGYFHLKEGDTT